MMDLLSVSCGLEVLKSDVTHWMQSVGVFHGAVILHGMEMMFHL